MSQDNPLDFDARDAVPEMLAELTPFIRRSAASIALDDAALAEDLVQEAAIQLWQMDPTRFDADDRDYVCGVLYKHMQDAARREHAARGGKNWTAAGGL